MEMWRVDVWAGFSRIKAVFNGEVTLDSQVFSAAPHLYLHTLHSLKAEIWFSCPKHNTMTMLAKIIQTSWLEVLPLNIEELCLKLDRHCTLNIMQGRNSHVTLTSMWSGSHIMSVTTVLWLCSIEDTAQYLSMGERSKLDSSSNPGF